jgi:hypothetical protein
MSHCGDLARYLLGDIESVAADTVLFIAERPRLPEDHGPLRPSPPLP